MILKKFLNLKQDLCMNYNILKEFMYIINYMELMRLLENVQHKLIKLHCILLDKINDHQNQKWLCFQGMYIL